MCGTQLLPLKYPKKMLNFLGYLRGIFTDMFNIQISDNLIKVN